MTSVETTIARALMAAADALGAVAQALDRIGPDTDLEALTIEICRIAARLEFIASAATL